jgi:hypothetical protein
VHSYAKNRKQQSNPENFCFGGVSPVSVVLLMCQLEYMEWDISLRYLLENGGFVGDIRQTVSGVLALAIGKVHIWQESKGYTSPKSVPPACQTPL